MKFVLVVYMCLAGACESVYELEKYDTLALCQSAGEKVKVYAMEHFPQSSGQLWCLTEEQFIEYQDYYKIGEDT